MTMLQTLTTIQHSTFNVQPLNYHCGHNVSPLLPPLTPCVSVAPYVGLYYSLHKCISGRVSDQSAHGKQPR